MYVISSNEECRRNTAMVLDLGMAETASPSKIENVTVEGQGVVTGTMR